MRLILDDRELSKIRQILRGLIRSRYHLSSYLFSKRQFKEWVDEVGDEAIGIALKADDWNPSLQLPESQSESPLALQIWFIFMKSWPIAKKSLGQERRHWRACANLAKERPPEYMSAQDRVLQNLDMERALPLLSSEQSAAISLVHFAQVPIAEAATILKLTRNAMDALLCRARKRLCEVLENPFLFDPSAHPVAPVPARRRGRPRKGDRTDDEPDPRVVPLRTSTSDDDDFGRRRLSG